MGGEASKLMVKHYKKVISDDKYASDEAAQRAKVQKLFKLIDVDNSGFLETTEIPALVQGIAATYKTLTKHEIEPGYIEAILQDADSNGDQSIDYDEFEQLLKTIGDLIQENIPQKKLKAGVVNKVKLRTSALSDEQLDKYYSAQTLEEILPTLNTGDILLFRGQGPISKVIKKLTFCCFSHVAMVLRNPSPEIRKAFFIPDTETEEVFIFESNATTQPPRPGGGTHIVTLKWKLERSVRNEDPNYLLCVRRLKMPKNESRAPDNELFPNLEDFILKMQGVSYEMQKVDLLASTTVIGTLPFKEDLSSVFCTELLTACYKSMGLLSPSTNPTNSLPRTFTSNQRLLGKFTVLRGASLDTEQRIRCSKTREQLLAEYQGEVAREAPTPISTKLLVKVISGNQLPGTNSFVKVSLRKDTSKTKSKKTNNPEWNEEFIKDLMSDWNEPYEGAHLSFTFFKKGLATDQFLGMAYIDLSAVALPFEGNIPLNTNGTVRVGLSLMK